MAGKPEEQSAIELLAPRAQRSLNVAYLTVRVKVGSMLAAVSESVVGAHTIRATVSIGAVQWRPEHHDIDAMMAQADEALYTAKRLGRNRVHLHRHDLDPGTTPPAPRAANDAA